VFPGGHEGACVQVCLDYMFLCKLSLLSRSGRFTHACIHACAHAHTHLHTQECFAYFVLVVEDARAVGVVFIAWEAEGSRAVVSKSALQAKCWAAGLLGGVELGL
jgi:hypothetical protein